MKCLQQSNSLWQGVHILISRQPDVNKIYLYDKNPYQAKHQLIINKHESAGLKHCNNPKAFIEYSSDVDEFTIIFTKILMNLIQIKHIQY